MCATSATLSVSASCGGSCSATRGTVEGGLPALRIIDRDTYRAELVADAAAAIPTPEDLHFDAALRLLRLLATSSSVSDASIESRVMNTVAYYSSDTGSITVIDRGEAMSLLDDVGTLAHEMTHAIQDRRHGLRAFRTAVDGTDARFARDAVVEGDATFVGRYYRTAADGRTLTETEWRRYFAGWRDGLLADIAVAEDRWPLARRGLLYPLGGNLAASIALREGASALDTLFLDPPATALAVSVDSLAGEGTLPAEEIDCAPPAAPPGMVTSSENRMGVPLVYAFVAEVGRIAEGWSAAQRIVADRLTIYGDGIGGRTAVAWRIRSATETDARGLIALLRTLGESNGASIVEGRDIVVALTNDAGAGTWVNDALAPCAIP